MGDGIGTQSNAPIRFARGIRVTPRLDPFSITPRLQLVLVTILAAFDTSAALCLVFAQIRYDRHSEPAVIVAAAGAAVVAQLFGLYAVKSSVELQQSALGALACGFILSVVIVFAASASPGSHHLQLLLITPLAAALLMVTGRLVCLLAATRFRNRFVERVALFGTEEATTRCLRSLIALPLRVKVLESIIVNETGLTPGWPANANANANANGNEPWAALSIVDRVLVLREGLADVCIAELARGLEAIAVPVHLLGDVRYGEAGAVQLGPAWLLHDHPIPPGSMFAKRAIDILIAGSCLLLTAPLMLAVALAIRVEGGGPILFRQVRLGRGNQPFTVLKFRTMRPDAPASDGSVQAVRGDPRVTKVGAVLRKSSLDELPQLINVLQGTMSLVGPRPHPTELNRRFVPLIDSYSARHRITPGITGWAQVNGWRGETRTVEQMRKRVEFDLEYIRCHSVAFDLWILLRTVISVILPRNAY